MRALMDLDDLPHTEHAHELVGVHWIFAEATRDRWLQDRGESLGGHPEAEQDDEKCCEFWHPTKAATNEAVPVRGALCKAACADQHEPDSHECHRHAETEGNDEHHAEPDPVEVDRAEEQ